MNHVYRLVWNPTLQALVAVCESARGRGKSGCKATSTPALLGHAVVSVLIAACALPAGAVALNTLPTGGQVSAGSAAISSTANTLTVNQSSQRAAINWQSFSVGSGATVNFVQPNASSVILNRVVGNEQSVIAGAMNANGQVFLLNSNGVLFTGTASVNVGGLVASTLNLSDADFMAGRNTFTANGSKASVINLGSITAADGGYVALLGNQVKNEGVITARLGTAILAAGDQLSLNFNGDSLVGVTIDQGTLNALVENKQAIYADGGLVVLTAKGLDAVMATVVNNTGEIRAQTLANREGKIYLLGGMENNRIEVGGALDASAPNGGNGGFVETSAASVSIANGTWVTTNAPTGRSGLWLIDPIDFTIDSGSGPLVAGVGGSIGVDTLRSNLTSTDITIDVIPSNMGDNRLLLNASLITNGDLGADRTLTLRSEGSIEFAAGAGIDATQGGNTRKLNVVLWTLNGGGFDGSIKLSDTSFIKTNNGHLWIGGGNTSLTSTTWNGLTVGNDYAYDAKNFAVPGVMLGSSVIDTGSGDISINAEAATPGLIAVTSSSGGLIKTSGNFSLKTVIAWGLMGDLQGRVVVGGTASFTAYSEGGGTLDMPNTGNRFANAPVYSGASAGTVAYGPLSIIYVRPVDGSSTYGSTPTIAYDLYTTAGAGSVVTDATPTGVWSGAPGATTAAGSYSLNYIGGIALGNDGYILAAGSPGSWTVNKAHLTVTADNASRAYGATNPTFTTTVSGFVNGQDATTAAGFNGAGDASTTATTATNVGTATITAGIGNLAATNYDFTNLVDGTLTIGKATLTVTASNASKVYGQTSTLSGFTSSGLVNNETIGSVTESSSGTAVTAGVTGSPYSILASAATGGTFAPGNYSISYVNGNLSVTPLAIAVTTNNFATRVYDGTADAAANLLYVANAINGDTVTLSGNATLVAGAVGTEALSSIAGLGVGNPNYTVFGGNASGSVSITEPASSSTAGGAPTLANTIANTIANAINAPSAIQRPSFDLPGITLPAGGSVIGARQPTAFVNVTNPLPAISAAFGPGERFAVVSSPSANVPTQAVTLAQARAMMQGTSQGGGSDGDRDVRVPVSRNSLADIVNGGVKLPDGVEQELFVVQAD